ncbi:MAG: acetamidase/formamidase family protein [Thermanaerothrix sp.]|uniref:acetamidase/formamidase family protein n=1 Tax=Thermanaerothrix sp. TaxID=2972675 RepID=UPI003C7C9E1D
MKRLTREHVFFAFAPDLQPALEVQPGEEVWLETHDCFEGQLKSEQDLIDNLDWNHVNPATGPLYVQGVKAGDVVRVDILELRVGERSTMVTVPGEGALGKHLTHVETVILPRVGDTVVFRDRVRVPTRPMIGVIGVAPREGKIPCGTPGPHGGNMDCTLIGEGASVYFTAAVEGALFGCGDFHAAMGDGEIVICGAETPGEVRLKITPVPALAGLPTPFVETTDRVATIYSAPTMDEASQGAIEAMAKFLTDQVGLSVNDAGLLMSLVGELKVCQVVDPLKTMRFEFPKAVLADYGYRLPR